MANSIWDIPTTEQATPTGSIWNAQPPESTPPVATETQVAPVATETTAPEAIPQPIVVSKKQKNPKGFKFFNPGPDQARFEDVTRPFQGLGEAYGGLFKQVGSGLATVAQAFPRAIKKLALSSKEYQASKGYMPAPTAQEITPTTDVAKFFFGKEPVKTLQQSTQETTTKFVEKQNKESQQQGVPVNQEKLQKLGKFGAIPFVAGGTLLDLFPLAGGGEESIAKSLAKENTVEGVTKILAKSTLHPDVVATIAPKIAETTDPSVIKTILEDATNAPKPVLKIKELPYNQAEYDDFLKKINLTDAEFRANLQKQGFSDIKLADQAGTLPEVQNNKAFTTTNFKGMDTNQAYDVVQKHIDDKIDENLAKGMSFSEASGTPELNNLFTLRNSFVEHDIGKLREALLNNIKAPEKIKNEILQYDLGIHEKGNGDWYEVVSNATKKFLDPKNEQEVKANIASKLLQDRGLEEGVFGPMSGYTPTGKEALKKELAKETDNIYESIKNTIIKHEPAQAIDVFESLKSSQEIKKPYNYDAKGSMDTKQIRSEIAKVQEANPGKYDGFVINNATREGDKFYVPFTKTAEAVANEGVPTMITRKMRVALEDAGYTRGDINVMKPPEAVDILKKENPSVLESVPRALKAEPVAVPKPTLSPEDANRLEELNTNKSLIEEQLKDHPGKQLVPFISKKEGEFLDIKQPSPKFSAAKNAEINARNDKLYKASMKAFEGTRNADQFDNPDFIKETIDNYNKIKQDLQDAKAQVRDFKAGIREKNLGAKEEEALNRLAERQGKKTEQMIARDEKIAQKKKLFDEAVSRANAAEAERARKKENIRQAFLQQDQPLTFYQKVRGKLSPKSILDKDSYQALRDWQRKRIKAPVLAEKEMGKIKVPRDQGLNTILNYQAGLQTPYTAKISEVFDNFYKEAKARGLDFGERANYLPQVYKESSDEIKAKVRDFLAGKGMTAQDITLYLEGKPLSTEIASNLKLTPSFAKDRVFPDYKTAMEWGLTPRFTDPDQLAAYYRNELEKTFANKEFLDDLISKGKLIPEQVAPPNWVPVQHLPLGQRGYFATPRLASVLDGIFKSGEEISPVASALSFTAKLSKGLQELALSAGIPKTNVNFFSMGQTIKELTAGNLKAIPIFWRSNFNKASIKFFEENQKFLEMMADQGISVGDRVGNYSKVYENWSQTLRDTAETIGKNPKKALRNPETYKQVKELFGDGFDKLFNDKTFGSFMPQLYTQTFKDEYLSAIKSGLAETEAKALAGDITRKMYGLIEGVGRSKETQDVLSAAFFAPRFRESIINSLANTGQAGYDFIKQLGGLRGPLNPALKRNRKLLAGMIISYGAYNALNYKLNGHFMWNNPPGKEFDLRIPTKNGDVIYVGFMPSFLSFAKNLGGSGLAFAKGDIKTGKQKLSSVLSMPVQLAMNIIGNYNYFGNPIYNDTDTTATKAKKVAGYIGLQVNHPYVKELIAQIGEKKPLYQSINNALELPAKFSTKDKEATNAFYVALDKKAKENSLANEKIKPIYNHVQDLVKAGKNDEAQNIVNNLTDEEYVAYKRVRSSDKARATQKGEAQMFDTVLQVRQLVSEGRTEEAQAIVDDLSDQEYHLYQLAKERLPASE